MNLKNIKLTPDDIKKFHAGRWNRFWHKLPSNIMWYLPGAVVILVLFITAILIAP